MAFAVVRATIAIFQPNTDVPIWRYFWYNVCMKTKRLFLWLSFCISMFVISLLIVAVKDLMNSAGAFSRKAARSDSICDSGENE